MRSSVRIRICGTASTPWLCVCVCNGAELWTLENKRRLTNSDLCRCCAIHFDRVYSERWTGGIGCSSQFPYFQCFSPLGAQRVSTRTLRLCTGRVSTITRPKFVWCNRGDSASEWRRGSRTQQAASSYASTISSGCCARCFSGAKCFAAHETCKYGEILNFVTAQNSVMVYAPRSTRFSSIQTSAVRSAPKKQTTLPRTDFCMSTMRV